MFFRSLCFTFPNLNILCSPFIFISLFHPMEKRVKKKQNWEKLTDMPNLIYYLFFFFNETRCKLWGTAHIILLECSWCNIVMLFQLIMQVWLSSAGHAEGVLVAPSNIVVTFLTCENICVWRVCAEALVQRKTLFTEPPSSSVTPKGLPIQLLNCHKSAYFGRFWWSCCTTKNACGHRSIPEHVPSVYWFLIHLLNRVSDCTSAIVSIAGIPLCCTYMSYSISDFLHVFWHKRGTCN